MRYKTAITAVLAALLLLTTALAAPVASATNTEADTTQHGTITWWLQPFFTGASWPESAPPVELCSTLFFPFSAGSVENNTTHTMQLFSDFNCRIPLLLPPAGRVPPHDRAALLVPRPASYMLCNRTICRPPLLTQ